MSTHSHNYKVLPVSVFGMVHVNAVMECQHCKDRLIKMLKYEDLKKVGDRRPTYYYQEPTPADPQGGESCAL